MGDQTPEFTDYSSDSDVSSMDYDSAASTPKAYEPETYDHINAVYPPSKPKQTEPPVYPPSAPKAKRLVLINEFGEKRSVKDGDQVNAGELSLHDFLELSTSTGSWRLEPDDFSTDKNVFIVRYVKPSP